MGCRVTGPREEDESKDIRAENVCEVQNHSTERRSSSDLR